MGELTTGGKTAVTAKNTARAKLEKSYGAVAIIVNQQAKDNLAKLQTTGMELNKQPSRQPQPVPVNFRVENGTIGDVKVAVDKSNVPHYGTVFAYTPAATATSNIDNWTLKPVNSFRAVIKGLPAIVAYLFSAVYKGSDEDDLVWTPAITKYVSN
jgi:hypothetical protein